MAIDPMTPDPAMTPQMSQAPDPSVAPTGQPVPGQAVAEPPKPPKKKRSFKVDKAKIGKHIEDSYQQDLRDRSKWAEMRLQRYAKLRGWLESKDYPWPNAANTALPLMMTDVLRTEDTLTNSALASRPMLSAIAREPSAKDKGEQVDDLLDYQFFIENDGENKLAELANYFVVDGTFFAFVPYIKHDDWIIDVYTLPAPPGGVDMHGYVLDQLQIIIPDAVVQQPDRNDPWTWNALLVDDSGKKYDATVEVYTEDKMLRFDVKRRVRVFDGPCVILKDIEDIVAPTRSANLQPPSPMNPRGARHVMMVDYPSADEVKRLQDNGYYDLMTSPDIDALKGQEGKASNQTGTDPYAQKAQKDEMAGLDYGSSEPARETYTRLTVFDRYDVDDDGFDEDVIFWYLVEPKLLVRARYLTEMYPCNPPRRPFAEARYIQVPGQLYGIGLPELTENTHDLMKTIFDQMVDAGTLSNTPFGFYRASSGVRPEIMRMLPGDLYPLSDPQNDINFPTMPQGMQPFGINTITMLQQFHEKETMQGDLQFGKVPSGKASALRTASTTQTILQQGDARPERILRRFFKGLSEIFYQMHELNQAFLPKGKQYRVIGAEDKGKDPYAKLDDPSSIKGRFDFEFRANILNTDKSAHAQVLQTAMATLVNPMMMQMGLVTPVEVYNLTKDSLKASGLEPSKYVRRPKDVPQGLQITAEDALHTILSGIMPRGTPLEDPPTHMQGFQELLQQATDAGVMSPGSKLLANNYMLQVSQLVKQFQQQQQMMQAAEAFAKQQGGQQTAPMPNGINPTGPANNPPVQKNEMLPENMTGGGGGAMGAQ